MGNRTTGSVVAMKPARVAPRVDGIEAVSTAALDVLEGFRIPTRAGSTSYPGAFAEILRHFAREMARRGFAFGPAGAVVETWRARARGRWLDASGIVRPEDALPVEESRSLVRVEGDQTLEVFENGGEWQTVVDGVDLVAFPSRAQAMRYVLDRVGAKDRAPLGMEDEGTASAAVVRLTPDALRRLAQKCTAELLGARARLARSRRFIAKQRRAAARQAAPDRK